MTPASHRDARLRKILGQQLDPSGTHRDNNDQTSISPQRVSDSGSGLQSCGGLGLYGNVLVDGPLPARHCTELRSNGSLAYYVLLVIKQLTTFSVPAFLFVSGFFVAYAARGSQFTFSWKMVGVRISNLVVPYLIWSVVIFAVDYILKVRYAPMEYLMRLATGNATPAYFFVPLLCQLYVLAPFVVLAAKDHWQWLCAGAMILHLAAIGATYMNIFDMRLLGIDWSWMATPIWLFVRWSIFFVLGIVSSFRLQSVKQMLVQAKWGLLIATFALAVLAVAEPEWLLQVTGKDWRGGALTLSTSLYAMVFIFCFLAFEKVEMPLTNFLTLLAIRAMEFTCHIPKG